MIALSIARAIAFIHTQCPPHQIKNMQMNVHGNIKASNVMINDNFTACLSDYGLIQLAEFEELSVTWHPNSPPLPKSAYCTKLSKESDIYNFGIILLDMLGGPRAPYLKKGIVQRKEEIKEGAVEFFEFFVEGKERKQALQVWDIALVCTNNLPEDRPSIEHILRFLGDVIIN